MPGGRARDARRAAPATGRALPVGGAGRGRAPATLVVAAVAAVAACGVLAACRGPQVPDPLTARVTLEGRTIEVPMVACGITGDTVQLAGYEDGTLVQAAVRVADAHGGPLGEDSTFVVDLSSAAVTVGIGNRTVGAFGPQGWVLAERGADPAHAPGEVVEVLVDGAHVRFTIEAAELDDQQRATGTAVGRVVVDANCPPD